MLKDLYPEHVAGRNFNYTLGVADEQLGHADDFLFDAGFIACQPAYEEYLDHTIDLLCQAVQLSPPSGGGIPSRHNWLASRGVDVGGPQLELFNVLREARNVHVHAAGLIDERLATAREALSAEGASKWERAAGTPMIQMSEGDRLPAGAFDPVAAIYAIGNLAVELNRRIVKFETISEERWADIVVKDFRQTRPELWTASTDMRVKQARAHATINFGAALPWLSSADEEIRAAIDRAPDDAVLP
jgi:hypothetical protein